MPNTRNIPENRPNPDPSVMTTEQLLRVTGSMEEKFEARLDGMDAAIKLIQQSADRSPTTAVLEQRIIAFTDLMNEKFAGIAQRFGERDKRTEQLSIADKTAIAAALQAQKEAAGAQAETNAASSSKQDNAFTKLIEQLQQTQRAMNKSIDDKIGAIMSRLDRGEGSVKGASDNSGWIFGLVGMVFAAVSLLLIAFKIVT